jgi:hypothetical protein
MAALSGITAVQPTLNTIYTMKKCGAALALAVPFYEDATSNSDIKAADANVSAATANARGITITSGANGGYALVATGGSIILVGTTMTVGMTYCVGATAGEIVPITDLTTGDKVTYLGTAATATQLDLLIQPTGVTKP